MAAVGTAPGVVGSSAWLPGREYEILSRIGYEGSNAVVFHIRLQQPPHEEFALKMIKHLVGEVPSQRIGHEQSTALDRGLGAEWRTPMSLPPHDCLVPVLHHYHADQPRLRDYVDASLQDAVADRTLFIVMPLYTHGSLRKVLDAERRSHPVAPFGLGWPWFGRQLLRMLRAIDHLISHDLVHGDIKDDQLFLNQHGQVVLGDFGEVWSLVDEDGLELRLRSRDELLERRAGVGPYKAPELRGRCSAHHAPLLKDVYAKAEGFSIGVVMYSALDCRYSDDVFCRLESTHLAEERQAEKGLPPSRPDDPTYGRKQPGWVYSTEELPALPASTPVWLAEVVQGLCKSDHCKSERRLYPREAIQMLEVEGVARAWSQLEDVRAQLTTLQQQIATNRSSHFHPMQQQEREVASITAATLEGTDHAQNLSEQLRAAKLAAQTADRRADKLSEERLIAMADLAKERTQLRAARQAQENEQRARVNVEVQLAQLRQVYEADRAKSGQEQRTVQLEMLHLREAQHVQEQEQEQKQQKKQKQKQQQQQQQQGQQPVDSAPYAAMDQEAPSGLLPLWNPTRDRAKRAHHSAQQSAKLRGWKKLTRADMPNDPRFAIAKGLDRIPPPPPQGLSPIELSVARARVDVKQAQICGQEMRVGKQLMQVEQYLVRCKCTVRAGPEASSAEIGKHKEGTVIDVIREAVNSKGLKVLWTTTYPSGWVKIATSKGKELLMPIRVQLNPEPKPEPEPEPEPLPEPNLRLTRLSHYSNEVSESEPAPAPALWNHSYRVPNATAQNVATRFCKKCKVVFTSEMCPAQHAIFM